MGITSEIKTISTSTLELLREDPLLVNTFLNAQWLPEYASWKEGYWSREDADKKKQEVRKGFSKPPLRQDWGVFFGMRQQWKKSYNWQVLEEQFLAEWETPELDLDKSWRQVTFLLAGYLPGGGDVHSQWKVPELIVDKEYDKDFLPFLVIENSKWDGLPLVNAVGAGAGIYCQRDYDPVRYLIPSEVDQILYGLLKLSRTGYQYRFILESEKPEPLPYIDWSDPEMLDDMTYYYDQIVDYYCDAVSQNKALLLYLT